MSIDLNEDIKQRFKVLKSQYPNVDIMEDGILCAQEYRAAKLKIMWMLKQDYWSDGNKLTIPYGVQVQNAITNKNIQMCPTWKRMSQVSYGLLRNQFDFKNLPDSNVCAEEFLRTAVVEVDKELGDSKSENEVILNGFNRYKDLVFWQIDAYRPDVIIICMDGALRKIPDAIYNHYSGEKRCAWNKSDDLCWGAKMKDVVFLWSYHPQATRAVGEGLSDEKFFNSICSQYKRLTCA